MSGSVTICGEPVRQAQKHHLLAYVPQSEEVDWSFPVSVWDVVMMGRYGYMNFCAYRIGKIKRLPNAVLSACKCSSLKTAKSVSFPAGKKKGLPCARFGAAGKNHPARRALTGVDVKTETAIIDLLRELKNDGHLIFVSTHDLGSVPEFCDHVVIINKTVLASGPTETTFTADNLIKAFGGALRTIKLDHTDNPEDSTHEFRVFTDDEGALITKREGKPYRRGVRNIEAALPK